MLLVYPPWGVGGIKMNAESVLCQGKRRIRRVSDKLHSYYNDTHRKSDVTRELSRNK